MIDYMTGQVIKHKTVIHDLENRYKAVSAVFHQIGGDVQSLGNIFLSFMVSGGRQMMKHPIHKNNIHILNMQMRVHNCILNNGFSGIGHVFVAKII